MHKGGDLAFAHRQLCTVFDFVAFALEPPYQRVTRIVGPVNDVDKLAGEKIKNTHLELPASFAGM